MALYLVIHLPRAQDDETAHPPSRLREMAEASRITTSSPRWLRTWSPDLHDDRIFSLWEARDAAEVERALTAYGYLNDREPRPIRVREWGPDDVLATIE